MKELDKNYNFFSENEKQLSDKYPGEIVVISGQKVVFNHKEMSKVIEFVKKLEAGTYIIQKCGTDETTNIQMFHTRVSF